MAGISNAERARRKAASAATATMNEQLTALRAKATKAERRAARLEAKLAAGAEERRGLLDAAGAAEAMPAMTDALETLRAERDAAFAELESERALSGRLAAKVNAAEEATHRERAGASAASKRLAEAKAEIERLEAKLAGREAGYHKALGFIEALQQVHYPKPPSFNGDYDLMPF